MSVKSHHPDYDKYSDKWTRCYDAAEGQDAIHKAGIRYLPSLKDQTKEDYDAYVKRATFFNATWRTISGLSGMIFRKPPKVEAPSGTEALLNSITQDGQSLGVLARNVVEECLTVGRAGIMVDYPAVNAEGITKADAATMNLRPTMGVYAAKSIINWRVQPINNKRVLTLVVLVEESEVAEDEFASKIEDRYRVLDLAEGRYRVRVFRINQESGKEEQVGEDMFPTMNGKAMDFIPFYFVSVDDTEADPDDPPLIDLVDLNLSHYRAVADYEHGCHFTGLPTGYIAGHTLQQGEKIYLGSQTMLVFPDPTTRVGFLEFSGAGLGALRQNIDAKEEQMAILGARMLEAQKRGIESAEAAGIHRAGENSMLASVAKAISIGMTAALQTFSDWAGNNGEVKLELNQDFFPAPMAPAELTALVTAWQAGAISKETLFDNLQQGQIISDAATFEQEQVKIEAQVNLSPQPAQTPAQ